jgi:hypothetical protein
MTGYLDVTTIAACPVAIPAGWDSGEVKPGADR